MAHHTNKTRYFVAAPTTNSKETMLTDPGAAVSLFSNHFWGEKHNGFDILYHNMKHGQKASSEFIEVLRESCSIEETYHKSLTKLGKQISGYTNSGSFVPLWSLLRQCIERLAVIHFELMQTWQNVSKDVLRYIDEQQKRHKTIKDAENGTQDVVQTIQVTTTALMKAKDTYHSRYADYEKAKRNDNASTKDVEKTENKLKKAQDEYKYYIEKYNNIRNEFQKKMINSCRHFQEVEERHLEQMRDFLRRYAQGWSMLHQELGKMYNEFDMAQEETTTSRLLHKLVEERGTGNTVPQPVQYEEAEVAAAFATSNDIYGELPPSITPMATGDRMSRKASIGDLLDRISNYSDRSMEANNTAAAPASVSSKKKDGGSGGTGSGGGTGGGGGGGFFRWRRNSIGEKSGKKKNSKSTSNLAQEAASNSVAGQVSSDAVEQPHVDDEGYSIPPPNPWAETKQSESSSSGDEGDDDDDRAFKPLKVMIKPLEKQASTEGNLDAIKASMELIRIASPTNNLTGRRTPTAAVTSGVRKSTSVSDQLVSLFPTPASRPSSDLLGLELDPTPVEPTPTVRAQSALPNPPRPPSRARPRPRAETPDFLGGGGQTKAPPLAASPWASFDVGGPSATMPRGPSPAPLLASEPIPLAVAFTETVHVKQKGGNVDGFQMRVQGELAFAFPAGILRTLTAENSASAQPLVFTLRQTDKLLKYQINDRLTLTDGNSGKWHNMCDSIDSCEQDADISNVEHQVRLNMAALGSHLRSLRDANPAANYFNVNVLRYEMAPNSTQPPLLLGVHWRREASNLAFRIDYKTHWPLSRADASTPAPTVRLVLPLSGPGVTDMHTRPMGAWSGDKMMATWQLTAAQLASASASSAAPESNIRARFNIDSIEGSQNVRPGTLAAQFLCESVSLSGLDMSLVGPGYRISLNKRRLISGKTYACEPGEEEQQSSFLPPTL